MHNLSLLKAFDVHIAPSEVGYVVLAAFAPCPNSWAMQNLCASDKTNYVGSVPTRQTMDFVRPLLLVI